MTSTPNAAPPAGLDLAPYLFFRSGCEAALAFYASCGLGRTRELLRYGERGLPMPNEAMRGQVMHASFEGPGLRLFASDNDDAEPMKGSALLLSFDRAADAIVAFDRLAEGAQVTLPWSKQVWGGHMGMLRDCHGVPWMLALRS